VLYRYVVFVIIIILFHFYKYKKTATKNKIKNIRIYMLCRFTYNDDVSTFSKHIL